MNSSSWGFWVFFYFAFPEFSSKDGAKHGGGLTVAQPVNAEGEEGHMLMVEEPPHPQRARWPPHPHQRVGGRRQAQPHTGLKLARQAALRAAARKARDVWTDTPLVCVVRVPWVSLVARLALGCVFSLSSRSCSR